MYHSVYLCFTIVQCIQNKPFALETKFLDSEFLRIYSPLGSYDVEILRKCMLFCLALQTETCHWEIRVGKTQIGLQKFYTEGQKIVWAFNLIQTALNYYKIGRDIIL